MRISPEGGARSTGVDQRTPSRDCAPTEESAVCCALPAKLLHPAARAVAGTSMRNASSKQENDAPTAWRVQLWSRSVMAILRCGVRGGSEEHAQRIAPLASTDYHDVSRRAAAGRMHR